MTQRLRAEAPGSNPDGATQKIYSSSFTRKAKKREYFFFMPGSCLTVENPVLVSGRHGMILFCEQSRDLHSAAGSKSRGKVCCIIHAYDGTARERSFVEL